MMMMTEMKEILQPNSHYNALQCSKKPLSIARANLETLKRIYTAKKRGFIVYGHVHDSPVKRI